MRDSHLLREKMAVSYLAPASPASGEPVAGIFFARLVGPDVLGQLAFGMSYVAMWSFVADMGAANPMSSWCPKGETWQRAMGYTSESKSGSPAPFFCSSLEWWGSRSTCWGRLP